MIKQRITSLIYSVGIDRAVFYTLIYRGWQIVAGVATVFLVARYFSPIEQGFYYTYSSLLALQIFVELGLTTIVMQFASHEKAHLKWTKEGNLIGDPVAIQRLRSLSRFALKWYGIASGVILVILVPIGFYFFGRSPDAITTQGWQFPWIWLVVITSGNLLISPIVAVLEGCGLVAEVARMRAVQDFLAYGSFWLGLIGGWGLMAAPLIGTLRLAVSVTWLVTRKRSFLSDLWDGPISTGFKWWQEVWPMQWKIALSWVSGFLIFQLFNPVLFAFSGAVVAGQMGMSLSVTTSINTIAAGWLYTKIPIFGQLIAKRKFEELDRLFFRTLIQTFCVCVFLGIVFFGGMIVLWKLHVPLVQRFLEPLPLGLLLLTSIVNIIISSEAAYLRAHKQEPFMVNSISMGILMGLSTYLLGRYFGAIGVVTGYFVISTTLGVGWATWIFITKRKVWHYIVENNTL